MSTRASVAQTKVVKLVCFDIILYEISKFFKKSGIIGNNRDKSLGNVYVPVGSTELV